MVRRFLLALLVAAATTVPLAAGSPVAQAAGSAALRVSVKVPTGAVLDNVPLELPVQVTWSAPDCPHGCDLSFYSPVYDRSREDVDVVAPGGTAGERVVMTTVPVNRFVPDYTDPDQFAVRRYLDAAHTGWESAGAVLSARVDADRDATTSGEWRREVSLRATETMILRSATAGATAQGRTVDFSADTEYGQVGLIAARGPQNGVLGIDGRTIDLAAPRYMPAKVVYARQFSPSAAGAPVSYQPTVTNATPPGRAASDVHVDGFFQLHVDQYTGFTDPVGGETPYRHSPFPPEGPEQLTALVAEGQQVTQYGRMQVQLTATVFGCPQGCRIVREDPYGEQEPVVLLDRTSPASSTLQQLTVRVPFETTGEGRDLVLYKGSTRVDVLLEAYTYSYSEQSMLFSHGWSAVSATNALEQRLMRTSTPGAGATYRVPGIREGREVSVVGPRGPGYGLMTVYVNGRAVKTVDLQADALQQRVVLASVVLPLRGRLTVVNTTPADRAAKRVDVDGLVVLEHGNDCSRC